MDLSLIKYVWNVYCFVTNHRQDLHTTETNDRKPFIACGFCGVKILPVIGYNKHSRHILGVHANIITAVTLQCFQSDTVEKCALYI